MKLDNQDIHSDVCTVREVVPAPNKRDYAIMARHDSIRIKYDDGVSVMADDGIFETLHRLGYRFVGGNRETGLLVFEN